MKQLQGQTGDTQLQADYERLCLEHEQLQQEKQQLQAEVERLRTELKRVRLKQVKSAGAETMNSRLKEALRE